MTPQDAPRSQFEQRMRFRRAATCVSAARIALAMGRLLEAEERLEEACRLNPDSPEARILLDRLRTAEPPGSDESTAFDGESLAPGARRWSHWVAVLIAVVSLAVVAWWRAPTPEESRIAPARHPQPSPRSEPRSEAPASVKAAPPGSRTPSTTSTDELFAVDLMGSPAAGRLEPRRLERGTSGASPSTAPRPSKPALESAAPLALRAAPAASSSGTPPRAWTFPVDAPPAAPTGALVLPGLVAGDPPAPPPNPPAPDAAPASLRDAAADEEVIGQVLAQYRDAYNRLDAGAAHRVWPSVDERALARAFAGLESQGITFEGCDLHVDGLDASAACRGRARYVPKVGDRDPISQSRRWTFRLHRGAAGWQIVQAEAR